jgi:heat shock protein HslJ
MEGERWAEPASSTDSDRHRDRLHWRGHEDVGVDERGAVMRIRRMAVVMAAAALVASAPLLGAGCGSGGSSGGDDGESTSATALVGTSWRLTGWSDSAQDPNDFTITAEFKDGRIGGTSAVNQYGGPYTAGDDGSFSVGDLAGTMMGGPEPDMNAEKTYLDLLGAVKAFALDGDTLTLSVGSGDAALTYTRTQGTPAP